MWRWVTWVISCASTEASSLAVGIEKQAGVHLDPPAKEGSRVDAGVVDEEEGERETHAIGVGEQPLAQIVDVLAQHGIIDDRQAGPAKRMKALP